MANGLLNPINPLQGLTGVPGVAELPGQQSYITGQGIQGGLTQLVDAISKQQNPLLAAGRTGLGFATGQQQGMQNLANFQKLRQDLMKGGLDITQSQLNIGEKQFDLSRKVSQQQNLYNLIRNLSPEQKALALSNEEEFAKMMIGNLKPTTSIQEYEYAVANGYNGSYEDYVKNVEKYRATSINMGAENKYASKFAEERASRDITFFSDVAKLPRKAQDINYVSRLIASPDRNLGAFADIQNNFQAAKIKFLGDDGKLAKNVSNSQLIDAFLGQRVFEAFRDLGLGVKGLDTVPEREYLEKTMAGQKTMQPDALLKMQIIARRKYERLADEFNEKLASGFYKEAQAQDPSIKPIEIDAPVTVKRLQEEGSGKTFRVLNNGKAYYEIRDPQTGQVTLGEEKTNFDFLKTVLIKQ